MSYRIIVALMNGIFKIIYSSLLYFLAPQQAEGGYVILCIISYLYFGKNLLNYDRNVGITFSFNFIFLIFLFICSFVVPIISLYFDIGLIYFNGGIVYKYICQACGLVQLGICIYSVTYKWGLNKIIKNSNIKVYLPKTVSKILVSLSLLLFIPQLFFNIKDQDATNDFENGYIIELIQAILYTVFLLRVIKQRERILNRPLVFIKENIYLITVISIIIIGALYIGDRTLPIFLGLFTLAIYQDYINRISLVKLMALGIPLFIMFYYIGQTRSGSNSLKNGGLSAFVSFVGDNAANDNEGITVIGDFMPSFVTLNRAVYICERDQTYFHDPEKILITILSPVPLIPTLFSNLIFDKPVKELSSAYAITNDYRRTVAYTPSGMGTHVVGDIYFHWGLLGIYFFFGLFGYIMGISVINRKTSIICAATYYTMFSTAIFIPRDTLYGNLRLIVYQLIIYYILISCIHNTYHNK